MLFLQRLLTATKNEIMAAEPRSKASVDAEASGLIKQIRAAGAFDRAHASRVAADRLRALGVDVPKSAAAEAR